jgi:hypothetical protein
MFNNGLNLIENAELIEIQTSAIQPVYKFPNNLENIERGYIESIIVLTTQEVTNSPTNKPVVNPPVIQNSFLRLFNQESNVLVDFPMYLFWNDYYRDKRRFYLNNFKVNFSLSSIYLNGLGQFYMTYGSSFLILFIFSKEK